MMTKVPGQCELKSIFLYILSTSCTLDSVASQLECVNHNVLPKGMTCLPCTGRQVQNLWFLLITTDAGLLMGNRLHAV